MITQPLENFNHGSLFSGIDGFGLAAEQMNWNNVFHCEINPILSEFLKQQYPNAASYSNITTTDFTIWRGRINLLTGGFPCQPYSAAGKQKGTADERHLWPQMLRAIREIKPPWIVGENVRGIINWSNGLVFNEVQTDLEAEGYEVQPFLLPASGVNAPHERYRTWFVAYSHQYRNSGKPANSNRKEKNAAQRSNVFEQIVRPSSEQITSNAKSSRQRNLSIESETTRTRQSDKPLRRIHRVSNVANSDSKRIEKHDFSKQSGKKDNSNRKFNEENYWRNFPTQSPICVGNDGNSTELL